LQGVTHRHLSDHLSELVEATLEDLSQSRCIIVEEDEISALNLGMISAYYYINYITIEAFSLSLKPKTKLRGLLEIVSAAAEFDDIPIRHHEDTTLRKIYDRLPVKVENANFNDPHFKTNLLLQAHFSRIQLPPDLESDQRMVLMRIVRLLQACVDVISSNGWLSPALATMELSQMCIQAMWDRDSPLKQIPHLTQSMLSQLAAKKVEQVFDLMEMKDKDRSDILQLDSQRMANVARFVNRYPNVEVQYEAPSKGKQGESAILKVSLEREQEDEDQVGPVIAPFYPTQKDEGWWLIVGDPKTKSLLAIKRVHFQSQHTLSLDFSPEVAGKQDFVLYFMCDSYLGVDQEFEFSIEIEASEEVDDDAMSE
jgi:pre-mRNA-splicing helicase BRR2